MRLRQQLGILLGVSLLLLAGVVAEVVGRLQVKTLREEILEEGVSNARHSTGHVAHSLVANDEVGIRQLLLLIKEGIEEISYCYVTGFDGEVVASTFPEGIPPDLLHANPLDHLAASSVRDIEVADQGMIDIAYRVLDGAEAELHIGLDERSILKEGTRLRQVSFLLIAGGVLLIVPAALLLIGRLTRPIEELTRRAAEFGETGRYREIVPGGGLEIDRLSQTFNTMAEGLQETIARVERSERQFRMLVETAREGLVSLDTNGRVTFANDRLLEMTAFSREEIIGRSIEEFFPPEERQELRARLGERSQGKGGSYELSVQRKDGGLLRVIVSASPIVDEEGKYAGSFGLLTDITDRKRSEEALRKAKEELERQNEELRSIDRIKDSLIRDVTHELKTPVAKQAMQMELLRELFAQDRLGEAGEILEVMERSIRRQEQVIRNILNLSRLEGGGRKFMQEEFRLDHLVEDVVHDYRQAIESHGMLLEVSVSGVTIASDREMVWHVLSNLLNNAVKFRRDQPGAWIGITGVVEEGEAVTLTVADNGIGLDGNERARAFDRFFQATASAEGSGVGLTIVKVIVEGLGGTIEIDSPGRGMGTTVRVRLPLPAAPQA